MVIRSPAARRERAREHARRGILEAAAVVFARRGYKAATLADLAEAAGFAPPSLYRYFGSKEEIFKSLVEMLAAEVTATFEVPVDRTQPLAERLRTLFEAQRRVDESRGEIFDIVLGNAAHGAPCTLEGRSLADPGAGIAYYEEHLAGWLKRNAARRELRHPPEVAARAIAGIVFAYHHSRRESVDPADRMRLVIDLALHGVSP
ncbi:MAG TPA: helix-turn-helix domain-containing protein [Anaeromyxobacteraceae bacterium]|nr:helix-turn-helix domain-containing protein [Anaeromyxobacteraceae bacterium]